MALSQIRQPAKPAGMQVASPSLTRYNSQAMDLLNLALTRTPYEALPRAITNNFDRGMEKVGKEFVLVTRLKTPLSDEHAAANLSRMRTAIRKMGIYLPKAKPLSAPLPLTDKILPQEQQSSKPRPNELPVIPVPAVEIHLNEAARPGGILDTVLSLIEETKKAPQKQYEPKDFWGLMGWKDGSSGKWSRDPEVCQAAALFHIQLVLRKNPEDVKSKDFLNSWFSGLFSGHYRSSVRLMLADIGLAESAEGRRKGKPKSEKPKSLSGEEVLGLVCALIAKHEPPKPPEKLAAHIGSPKKRKKLAKKQSSRYKTWLSQSAAVQATQGNVNYVRPESCDMRKHFWPLAGWPEDSNGKWKDPQMREAAFLFFTKLVSNREPRDCTTDHLKEAGLLGALRHHNMSVYEAFKSVKSAELVTESDEAYMRARGRHYRPDQQA